MTGGKATVDIREISLEQRPGIKLQSWSDDVYSHYMLVGKRFNDQEALLDLMLKYTGACKLDQKQADMDFECKLDCQHCKHSIYHEIELRRKLFGEHAIQLCNRRPRAKDEWEVNLVMRKGRIPKFQTFLWSTDRSMDDTSIIDIIFESIRNIDQTIFAAAQLCYVKIRRFDAENPTDVSLYANNILKAKCKEAGIELGIN